LSDTPSILVVASDEPPLPCLDRLRALGDVRLAEDVDDIAAALGEVEVVLAWDFRSARLRDAWPATATVRWIHAASIGVDTLLFEEVVNSGVIVTNTRGLFERPVAEYVLALMLLFAKDLRATLALQREGRWRYRETETLAGRRLVLCGAGAIAREIARIARLLGMEVVAVGRRPRRDDPAFGVVHGVAELDALLAQASYLVLTLPLTNETRGLLDAARLARLPRGARVINVGRGAVIDEPALLDALQSGHVAAAALDVFADEPLPPDHPFWAMPQVVVSPHMAGDVVGWRDVAVDAFLENLGRWRSGRPLLHVIDKRRDALTSHAARL
jgi:phosphoglycerate dehydrogenase-like enzyme